MMMVQVLLFFSTCITYILEERLASITELLGNKDESPGNEEA